MNTVKKLLVSIPAMTLVLAGRKAAPAQTANPAVQGPSNKNTSKQQ